jgi:hypothetical protein
MSPESSTSAVILAAGVLLIAVGAVLVVTGLRTRPVVGLTGDDPSACQVTQVVGGGLSASTVTGRRAGGMKDPPGPDAT